MLIGAVFLLVVTACGTGGGAECTGTLTADGKAFTGRDKDPEKAKRNACNHYCREADPEYDARYRIWLDSPKGKAAGRPSKQEAIFKDSELMDFVTITCADRCLQDAAGGKYKIESTCGK